MTPRPLRSVLFLPADNPRALAKARTLPCDAVVLDLEDAVAPERKSEGRAAAVEAVRAGGWGERLLAVRVNALDTPWGAEDLAALGDAAPEAVVAPKVGQPEDVRDYAARLADGAQLWAMVETCRGVLHAAEIARSGPPLAALVVGTNDLSKDMGRPLGPDRRPLHAALSTAVMAARACGLHVIDGVFNTLDDPDGLSREAAEGRSFGFDGKSLIHPSQVEPVNRAFGPAEAELAWARAVVEAFAAPENAGKGAVRAAGAMVERLHLEQAEALLRLAG